MFYKKFHLLGGASSRYTKNGKYCLDVFPTVPNCDSTLSLCSFLLLMHQSYRNRTPGSKYYIQQETKYTDMFSYFSLNARNDWAVFKRFWGNYGNESIYQTEEISWREMKRGTEQYDSCIFKVKVLFPTKKSQFS